MIVLRFLIILFFVINLSSSIVIRCKFEVSSWDEYLVNPYTCKVSSLRITTQESVEKLKGQHKENQKDENVKGLIITNSNCEYFPTDFNQFFTALEGISIINSNLRVLRQRDLVVFPKLKSLLIPGNKILTLEYALLSNNPHLRSVSFANNKIIGIASDFFDFNSEIAAVDFSKNPCMDMSAKNEDEIAALVEVLNEKCPPTEDLKELKELLLSVTFVTQDLNDCKISLNNCINQCKRDIKPCDENSKKQDVSLQKCRKELSVCKANKPDKSQSTSCTATHDEYHTIIECDEFYESTCISSSTIIPFEGTEVFGVKLPNETVIDGFYITELVLTGNGIRGWPTNFGSFFQNLNKLIIKSARINEIRDYYFKELVNLIHLEIVSSNVYTIHKESFSDLQKLEILNVSNNKLVDLEEIVKHLNSLKQFIANNNQFTRFEWKYFKKIENIEIIEINGNKLEFIDTPTFSSKQKLQKFELDGNKCVSLKYPEVDMKTIVEAIRKGCPFAVDIKCDFKQDGEDFVCDAKDVSVINENTVIKNIYDFNSTTSTSIISKVTKLIINNQVMQYVPSNLFTIFGNVRIFQSDSSKLIYISNMIGLKEVKITNCNVEYIDQNAFAGSPDLEFLSLEYNKIRGISKDAFKFNRYIKEINLSFNKFTVINTECFENIEKLQVVSLKGNKAERIVINKPIDANIDFSENSCIDLKYSSKIHEDFKEQIYANCAEKLQIECDFKLVDDDYICNIVNLNIDNQNTKIVNITSSNAVNGYTIQNVTKIVIKDQNMLYFPNNFQHVFPGMIKIEVASSNLKKVSKLIGENLVWVQITGNSIEEIDGDSFTLCKGLKYIDISNNKIIIIPNNLLEETTEIEYVNFERNELEILKFSMFSFMTELKVIKVGYNRIKRVDWMQLPVEIELIDMSGNSCINNTYTTSSKDEFLESINNECGVETVLKCNFVKKGKDYICKSVNLVIENENTRISGIEGIHLPGMSNQNVSKLECFNQNVVYYPLNIRDFFTTLKLIDIKSRNYKYRIIFLNNNEVSIEKAN